jgi:hypothetical protein
LTRGGGGLPVCLPFLLSVTLLLSSARDGDAPRRHQTKPRSSDKTFLTYRGNLLLGGFRVELDILMMMMMINNVMMTMMMMGM